MASATPSQAVAHPNWSMGAKISVDSATMMNKGLELIEAHHLFGLSADEIEILVHPESIVHSLVGFRDGSVLAQLGLPDMRIPIAYTLGWPDRSRRRPHALTSRRSASSTRSAGLERFPRWAGARGAGRGGAVPACSTPPTRSPWPLPGTPDRLSRHSGRGRGDARQLRVWQAGRITAYSCHRRRGAPHGPRPDRRPPRRRSCWPLRSDNGSAGERGTTSFPS